MTEKINVTQMIKKGREGDKEADIIEWAIISAITQKDMTGDLKANEDGEFIVDVDFKINGIEVKFSKLLVIMFKHFDEEMEKGCRCLIDDLIQEPLEKIEEAANEFQEALKEVAFDKFGKKICREDE